MSAMTLERVRDYLREDADSPVSERGFSTQELSGMADAIDAHLTIHAQMVEKVREVISWLDSLEVAYSDDVEGMRNKLAAAIGDKS